MVVAVGPASREFCGMIRMNATGAFLWNALAAGTTEDALVQKMLEHYDRLNEQTARRDLQRFVETLAPAIEET